MIFIFDAGHGCCGGMCRRTSCPVPVGLWNVSKLCSCLDLPTVLTKRGTSYISNGSTGTPLVYGSSTISTWPLGEERSLSSSHNQRCSSSMCVSVGPSFTWNFLYVSLSQRFLSMSRTSDSPWMTPLSHNRLEELIWASFTKSWGMKKEKPIHLYPVLFLMALFCFSCFSEPDHFLCLKGAPALNEQILDPKQIYESGHIFKGIPSPEHFLSLENVELCRRSPESI